MPVRVRKSQVRKRKRASSDVDVSNRGLAFVAAQGSRAAEGDPASRFSPPRDAEAQPIATQKTPQAKTTTAKIHAAMCVASRSRGDPGTIKAAAKPTTAKAAAT